MGARILCLEGVVGSGKTTQSRKIEEYLKESKISCLVVNEKWYEPFKEVVTEWHKKGANQRFSKDEVISFAEARGEVHKKYLFPLLDSFVTMLFDRCFYTSGVYQSDGELTVQEILEINERYTIIKPESGFVLICEPTVALERANIRRKTKNGYNLPSMNETLEEVTKRRELYIELANQRPELTLIDTTSKSEPEVFEEIRRKLKL